MKKLTAILLALALACCLFTACGEKTPTPEVKADPIALGTSGYTIVAEGYVKGEISEEDTDENQVAYYANENSKVDFDVYMWAKATDETLEAAATAEAAEYEATAATKTFGTVTVYAYNAVEDYDGTEYNTVTYLMEDGDYIVELVFWLDGENPEAAVEAIMNTLTYTEKTEVTGKITLGTSNLTIVAEGYVEGEMTEEDTDENQVAYYTNANSLVDIDVYMWAKATDETLEAAATDEAAEYEATAETKTVNDITVYFYKAVEEYEEKEYNTVTYLMEDGDYIVELVFWLDGENAEAQVDTILNTLSK